MEKDISNIVDRVFNADQAEFKEKMGSILKIDSFAQKNVTLFWKRVGYVAASFVAILFLMLSFPDQVKKVRRGLASALTPEKSASDLFVEKTQKEREERSRLNIETRRGYYDSYVENILYSSNYIDTYRDRDIQQEWILALNDFFGEELEISDNAVVQFVSKENSLVNDLATKRGEINPQFFDSGVEKMKKAEIEFVSDVKQLLKSESNYRRYKAFQKQFFSDKLQ